MHAFFNSEWLRLLLLEERAHFIIISLVAFSPSDIFDPVNHCIIQSMNITPIL